MSDDIPATTADPIDDTPPRRVTSGAARISLAIVRILYGFTFFWAFLDKVFGLGYSTKHDDAWINGGNPTLGYLKFGSKGPFKDFYTSIAGEAWVNVLFMLALLALGVALILGIGMRLAGIGGFILYIMMWTVALPPETNPAIDEHILGAFTLAALALTRAGDTVGLGGPWSRTGLVRSLPFLR